MLFHFNLILNLFLTYTDENSLRYDQKYYTPRRFDFHWKSSSEE